MLGKLVRKIARPLVLSSLLLQSSAALALDLKPEDVRGKGQQSPVTILQNRYFLKTLRPELGLAYGTITNEAYTDTSLTGVRGGLFLNEWVGVEFQTFNAKVSDSDDLKALKRLRYAKIGDPNTLVTPDPEVNRIKKISDLTAVIAPFYGKINLADWLIIYSDLYGTLGVTKLDTDQGDINGFTWGAGQRFYWQKFMSFRIDFKSRMYTEQQAGQDHKKTTYSVDFGLSIFLL